MLSAAASFPRRDGGKQREAVTSSDKTVTQALGKEEGKKCFKALKRPFLLLEDSAEGPGQISNPQPSCCEVTALAAAPPWGPEYVYFILI